eukprot:8740128-Pyramimonas_sp.AAC.1
MATKHPSWPCGNCARVYGTACANYAYRSHCIRCGKQTPRGMLEKQKIQLQGGGAAGGVAKRKPPWQQKNRWEDGPPVSLFGLGRNPPKAPPAAQSMVDQATARAMLETMVKAHGEDRK